MIEFNVKTINVKVKVPEAEACNGCDYLAHNSHQGNFCILFRKRLNDYDFSDTSKNELLVRLLVTPIMKCKECIEAGEGGEFVAC